MYRSDTLIRWLRNHDPREIVVRTEELDPTWGEWTETQVTYTTSYDIVGIDTRGATEIYVLGRAPNGDSVIEQWILNDVPGSWTAVRSRAETPFGVPYSGSTSIEPTIVGGGPFQVDRARMPDVTRIELYRGKEYGEIPALAPDLAGRFLHFAGGVENPGIFTIGLFGLPPEQPTFVIGVDDLPQLVECDDMGPHYNTVHGWAWKLHPANPYQDWAVAFDPDNDGIPDWTDFVTDETFFLSYPAEEWEFELHDWWW